MTVLRWTRMSVGASDLPLPGRWMSSTVSVHGVPIFIFGECIEAQSASTKVTKTTIKDFEGSTKRVYISYWGYSDHRKKHWTPSNLTARWYG
jgi:hypothetical protein